MTPTESLMKWVTRGIQRHAVTRHLHRPQTSAQLWNAAKRDAPRLTMRDTRAILRDLESRGLASCLNPSALTGRIYAATNFGGELLRLLTPGQEPSVEKPLAAVTDSLAFVLRGRVRHAVFRTATTHIPGRPTPTSASTIKRHLRNIHPVTLNQTIRALRELERAGIVETVPSETRIRHYGPTEIGKLLVPFIPQVSTPFPAPR